MESSSEDVTKFKKSRNETSDKVTCCVDGCSEKGRTNSGVSYHRFPKVGRKGLVKTKLGVNEEVPLRETWAKQLKLRREPSDYMTVCSRHFEEENFSLYGIADYEDTKKYLKKNAIPTINLPGQPMDSFLQKKISQSNRLKRKLNRETAKELVQSSSCSLKMPISKSQEVIKPQIYFWRNNRVMEKVYNKSIQVKELSQKMKGVRGRFQSLNNHKLDVAALADHTYTSSNSLAGIISISISDITNKNTCSFNSIADHTYTSFNGLADHTYTSISINDQDSMNYNARSFNNITDHTYTSSKGLARMSRGRTSKNIVKYVENNVVPIGVSEKTSSVTKGACKFFVVNDTADSRVSYESIHTTDFATSTNSIAVVLSTDLSVARTCADAANHLRIGNKSRLVDIHS